jgi:hypothetical protein
VNDQLLEELLNEDEGSALDFKRDQYPFAGASDEQKSELLKDILSFANAWRRTDAFILIGVKEVRGSRSEVVGISTHLDESHIQQFVNSKTQRPVYFSYQTYAFEGAQIGVLRIPKQARPLYAKATYGQVRGGLVYLRRGSATAIADPDEIARMGREDQEARAQPSVRLELADFEDRTTFGLRAQIQSVVIAWPPSKDLPDFGDNGFAITQNRDYWRQLADFVSVTALAKPLGFALTNDAPVPAKDAQIQITCARGHIAKVFAASEYPAAPRTFRVFENALVAAQKRWTWQAVRHRDSWTLSARVGSIQPKETWWSPEPFYIGATETGPVELQARVFADNLAEPVTANLTIEFSSDRREHHVGHLLDYHSDER